MTSTAQDIVSEGDLAARITRQRRRIRVRLTEPDQRWPLAKYDADELKAIDELFAAVEAALALRTPKEAGEVMPEHLSPLPWKYVSVTGHVLSRDWIEDANGNTVVEHIGHIDGPFIVARANAAIRALQTEVGNG